MNEQGLTVGRYLQQQREERKISLESVAKVTRITLANLQALESDEFQRLPAEAFTRGFLRIYAKFLKLDAVEVLAQYQLQVEAGRKQFSAEESAARRSPSLLKNVFGHGLDFFSTIMGASPPFSLGKAVLPPKD